MTSSAKCGRRAVFVDHPVGRTFGPPHDRARNEAVLERALVELPNFAHMGEIRDPGFQWSVDGGRAWEEELRLEMRQTARFHVQGSKFNVRTNSVQPEIGTLNFGRA
jgi:hypothetical protein